VTAEAKKKAAGDKARQKSGLIPARHRVWQAIERPLKRFFGPGVAVVVFGAALWVLYRELENFRYEDVVQYLATLSPVSLLLALGLTALSYTAFIGHDALALRYVGHPLPYRRVALASLIGFGISNAAGQAWLTGGAVRYRLYQQSGLSIGEIGRVVAFSVFTFWLGYIAWGAGLFLLGEPSVSSSSVLPLSVSLRALGWVCLGVLGLYLAWCAAGWSVKSFRPPPLPMALAQVGLAIVRTALTGGVLYVLLWGMPGASYFEVLGAFVLAIAAGGLGMVPGAAGVLEAVALLVLSSSMPTASVFGALLVFRAIYYLLPLAAGAGAFALIEARRLQEEGLNQRKD
jgi:uncharacterized membrane protein YbhN (UPF0104 family)